MEPKLHCLCCGLISGVAEVRGAPCILCQIKETGKLQTCLNLRLSDSSFFSKRNKIL